MRKTTILAGIVALVGAAVYVFSSDDTIDEDDFSTRDISVWQACFTGPPCREFRDDRDHNFFIANFPGVNDENIGGWGQYMGRDAEFSIDREVGAYNVEVRVVSRFRPIWELGKGTRICDSRYLGLGNENRRFPISHRTFTGRASSKDSLVDTVKSLLERARDYSLTPQYEEDKRSVLESDCF